MKRLLVYSANLGNFDKPKDYEEQELPEGIDQIEYWRCTDEDFPPRFNSMTPRLQARIVKMFGWQMKPGFDYYLWVDSSCRLSKPDSVKWFMDKLGSTQMTVFKHPNRSTVKEEADYLKQRLIDEREGRKQKYVMTRYDGEDIDGALSEVNPNAELYASTSFIYRNTADMQKVMQEWWYQTSRYHSIDQLSLPHCLNILSIESDEGPMLNISVIPDKYTACYALEYTR